MILPIGWLALFCSGWAFITRPCATAWAMEKRKQKTFFPIFETIKLTGYANRKNK
jgi:hypothetical protein